MVLRRPDLALERRLMGVRGCGHTGDENLVEAVLAPFKLRRRFCAIGHRGAAEVGGPAAVREAVR